MKVPIELDSISCSTGSCSLAYEKSRGVWEQKIMGEREAKRSHLLLLMVLFVKLKGIDLNGVRHRIGHCDLGLAAGSKGKHGREFNQGLVKQCLRFTATPLHM